MGEKGLKRYVVLTQAREGNMTGVRASEVMGISLRHERRLMAAFKKEGADALIHGNRGRKPAHAICEELKSQILYLAETTYTGFNNQHFTELLGEREGIKLSRSSVRRILLGGDIRSPRKRHAPKHRSRRERYSQEGMLLQIDGSHHDWLEGRGPWLCLIAAIDDANGIVPYALFRESEDTIGYIILLREIVCNYGIPEAIYRDRHSIFEVSPDKLPSIKEQLEGKNPQTQLGRILDELGITSIAAHSPQAKGRIERLGDTFQDRLVSELRLAGARTIDEANKVLWEFLPRFNQKFAVPAKEPGSAYMPVSKSFDPDKVFCLKQNRVVGADNVVSLEKHRLQIMPTNGRASYAQCHVEVHQRPDESLAVYYQGKLLITKPAPLETSILRKCHKVAAPIPANRVPALASHKPAPDHPWRGRYRKFVDKGNGG